MVIHPNSHKEAIQLNSNTTCWKWCISHSNRFLSSLILVIGSDISLPWVGLIWIGSVYMWITRVHLSRLTWTLIMILSFSGNSFNSNKKDISTSGKGPRSSHQKTNKCALIMTDQKVKELVLRSLLWSRSRSLNSMKSWKKQVWKGEKSFWLLPLSGLKLCTVKLAVSCFLKVSTVLLKWEMTKFLSAVRDLPEIWPIKI